MGGAGLTVAQLAVNSGSNYVLSMALAKMVTLKTLQQRVEIAKTCFFTKYPFYVLAIPKQRSDKLLQSDDTRYIPRAILIDLEPRVCCKRRSTYSHDCWLMDILRSR